VFLAITGAVALATGLLGFKFSRSDYWDYHGFLFLVFIAFFPRLTLLFSSVPSGGALWWLSWLIAPRLLVAVLATLNYWNQNPLLVVTAWLIALGGESSEKMIFVRQGGRTRGQPPEKGFESAKWVDIEARDK
jgi:hypothetical protein